MTYIKLEDVIEIMQSEIDRLRWSSTLEWILERINSLPSINPESMIESNKIQDWYTTWNTRDFEKWYNQALQELLQRFKS